MRPVEIIAAVLAGIVLAELLLTFEDALRKPPAPDPLDPIVSRERWDVWRAAEQATRHPIIDGECTDATG